MNRSNWFLAILIIILLIATFTNPSIEHHKQEVRTIISRHITEKLVDKEANDFEALGAIIGNSMLEKLIDNFISRDNYVVFSITKVNWKGKDKVIGYGLFGNVFLFDHVKNILSDIE